jgi:hypothetical protein
MSDTLDCAAAEYFMCCLHALILPDLSRLWGYQTTSFNSPSCSTVKLLSSPLACDCAMCVCLICVVCRSVQRCWIQMKCTVCDGICFDGAERFKGVVEGPKWALGRVDVTLSHGNHCSGLAVPVTACSSYTPLKERNRCAYRAGRQYTH